ncbi:MAG: UMP kinase, partial [Halofilum sp. (in: g-proteobacteria)]
FERITYDQVFDQNLAVMDATAVVMCRDHDIPLRVFNLNNEGDLIRVVRGENVGTTVERGSETTS